QATNIAVVIGSSSLERAWRSEAEREFQIFGDRVRFRWFDSYTFEEMKREVSALAPDSAILFVSLWRDGAGVTFQSGQGLLGLRSMARVPIFACFESDFGSGVVGGRHFANRSAGIQAAAVAARIFDGESPSSVSVAPLGSLPPNFDWRELERFGI